MSQDGEGSGTELGRIEEDLHALRQKIVDAWQERAVILTQAERQRLREEITETCKLLTDLVAH